MYKLVLIFALALISQNAVTSDNVEPDTAELKEWVYWDAFSQTFNETADYWKAESAALEAQEFADDRTDVDQFLREIEEKEEIQKDCEI